MFRERRSYQHELESKRRRHRVRRKSVVTRYIEGFIRSDHEQILSCLSDDIVWAIHGHRALEGKDAFDAEIEGQEGYEGGPEMTIDRMIEEDDVVAAQGHGRIPMEGGGGREFVFCEVYTFTGEAVSRLDTYHVWLD